MRQRTTRWLINENRPLSPVQSPSLLPGAKLKTRHLFRVALCPSPISVFRIQLLPIYSGGVGVLHRIRCWVGPSLPATAQRCCRGGSEVFREELHKGARGVLGANLQLTSKTEFPEISVNSPKLPENHLTEAPSHPKRPPSCSFSRFGENFCRELQKIAGAFAENWQEDFFRKARRSARIFW